MRARLHIIKKFGYDTYMAEFGGEGEEMQPHRLVGWACYIAAVEPDVGYPLMREFDELLPEGYWVREEEGLVRSIVASRYSSWPHKSAKSTCDAIESPSVDHRSIVEGLLICALLGQGGSAIPVAPVPGCGPAGPTRQPAGAACA